MPQSVDRHVQLRSLFSFRAIISGARARDRAQCAAVDNRHCRLSLLSCCQTQNGPERIGVIRGIGDDVTDTLQAAQQSPGPVGNRRIIRVLDGDGSANQSRRRQREVWSSAPA